MVFLFGRWVLIGQSHQSIWPTDRIRSVHRASPPLFRLGGGKFEPYVSQPSKTIEKQEYRKYFTAVHRDNIGRREVCDFSLKIKCSESSGRQPVCIRMG
jgi:hypothetical protein